MRKADIKPGVLYAYKHFGPRDVPVPIVFFSAYPWLHTLYRPRPEAAPERPLFTKAQPGDKPGRGSGSLIGYPAATLRGPASDAGREKLLGLTLRDFETATSAREHGIKFLVVGRLATVVCKWEDWEQ